MRTPEGQWKEKIRKQVYNIQKRLDRHNIPYISSPKMLSHINGPKEFHIYIPNDHNMNDNDSNMIIGHYFIQREWTNFGHPYDLYTLKQGIDYICREFSQ
jgi:hypothetical protein